MRRSHLLAMLAAIVVALGACGSAGTSPASKEPSSMDTTRDPQQRYRVSTTVLESLKHGPQLCLGGTLDSHPPQCGGPDIAGLDWGDVEKKESANGTTWADVTLVGTYDGSTFTLTEPPAAPSPMTSSPDNLDFSPACDEPDGEKGADQNTFSAEHPDVVAVWVTADRGIFNVYVRPGATERVRAHIRDHYAGLLCIAERDQPTQAELQALQSRVSEEADDAPFGGVFMTYTDDRKGIVIVGCAIADAVSKEWARDRWGDRVVLSGYLKPVP